MQARREAHGKVAAWLAAKSDAELLGLVPLEGAWREHFHGGRSGTLQIEGAKVFVKHVALTDLERGANAGSTANMFGLPMFYQYGVGSAGFGAERELLSYLKASDWALSGACPYFPLVHHWRVLPRPESELSERQKEWMERAFPYWDHSDAIRERIAAIAAARASIVLFMECVPDMLGPWLENQPDLAAAEPKILRFHEQLAEAAAFMNARGMLHFDLHTGNVMTDGGQIFVTDFGLAICDDFDLSAEERTFCETHQHYDRAYVSSAVSFWLAGGESSRDLSPGLKDLLRRLKPESRTMGAFLDALREDKHTPYPAAEIGALSLGDA
ncbi:MAG: protein kinase [Caulobacteraceae bacterium]